MARFGLTPGERGTLETRTTEAGVVQGFFVPRETPARDSAAATRLGAGVKVLEADPASDMLTMFPIDTRPWSGEFLGPKYTKIVAITVPTDMDSGFWDVPDALEELPSGFTKDYEYGLGLAREYEVIVHLIEEHTDCSRIELVASGTTHITGDTFVFTFKKFDELRAKLSSVKSRGQLAIQRVKKVTAHNELAEVLGIGPLGLSLGRLPTSKWMTQVAAGEVPLSDTEQDELLAATAASAAQIAARAPMAMLRLQQDIELVNLDSLIENYAKALDQHCGEEWWQKFFEQNSFSLQLIFGGPTVFIESQISIGESGKSTKGRKIADYLFKSALTGNAVLVEIKKPSTKLLKHHPYRSGVYGVQSEIGEAVTQVLDQALQLSRHELGTKERTANRSWTTNAPRCFVIAGRADELDTGDKQKSFDLYREHLSRVRLVTYDEILVQLHSLRAFLLTAARGASDGPSSVP